MYDAIQNFGCGLRSIDKVYDRCAQFLPLAQRRLGALEDEPVLHTVIVHAELVARIVVPELVRETVVFYYCFALDIQADIVGLRFASANWLDRQPERQAASSNNAAAVRILFI